MKATRTCSVEDCDRAHRCRGWCNMHYTRWYNHGDPLHHTTPEDRFWSHVEVGDCWEWTACITRYGYGWVNYRGSPQLAHRLAWTLLCGPIPEGLHIDHLCRNTACVNPDHLEPVPKIVNDRRGYAGAMSRNRFRSQTHCKSGHEFTAENTYITATGTRSCRACHREWDRARYWRMKVAA